MNQPGSNTKLSTFLSAKILIRVAATICFFHALSHTTGYPWTRGLSLEEDKALEAMQTSFLIFEKQRTYWDFYIGFGLGISILQLAVSLILWFTSTITERAPGQARSIVGTTAIAFWAVAVLTWRFFFLPPFIFSVLLALILSAAILQIRPANRQEN